MGPTEGPRQERDHRGPAATAGEGSSSCSLSSSADPTATPRTSFVSASRLRPPGSRPSPSSSPLGKGKAPSRLRLSQLPHVPPTAPRNCGGGGGGGWASTVPGGWSHQLRHAYPQRQHVPLPNTPPLWPGSAGLCQTQHRAHPSRPQVPLPGPHGCCRHQSRARFSRLGAFISEIGRAHV